MAVDLETECVTKFLGAVGDVARDFGAELFDLAPGSVEGFGGAAKIEKVGFVGGELLMLDAIDGFGKFEDGGAASGGFFAAGSVGGRPAFEGINVFSVLFGGEGCGGWEFCGGFLG